MTVANWFLFVALLLPWIYSVLSRSGVRKTDYVGDPRTFNEGLSGWRRRAHLAQLNSFEAFPAFAAAVLVAQQAGAVQPNVDLLAAVFVALRLLHGAFYLAGKAQLRSLAWQLSMLCIVGLFVVAAV